MAPQLSHFRPACDVCGLMTTGCPIPPGATTVCVGWMGRARVVATPPICSSAICIVRSSRAACDSAMSRCSAARRSSCARTSAAIWPSAMYFFARASAAAGDAPAVMARICSGVRLFCWRSFSKIGQPVARRAIDNRNQCVNSRLAALFESLALELDLRSSFLLLDVLGFLQQLDSIPGLPNIFVVIARLGSPFDVRDFSLGSRRRFFAVEVSRVPLIATAFISQQVCPGLLALVLVIDGLDFKSAQHALSFTLEFEALSDPHQFVFAYSFFQVEFMLRLAYEILKILARLELVHLLLRQRLTKTLNQTQPLLLQLHTTGIGIETGPPRTAAPQTPARQSR